MNKTLLYISIFFAVSFSLKGQDAQFSQFYNTSLSINPAFTGGTECYRAGMTARTQWLGLKRAYNTTLAYVDFNYEDYNSGIGFIALYDQSGVAKLSNIELSALYSYQVQYKKYNLKLGLQGAYSSKRVDYSQILFEDQFNQNLDIDKKITDDPIKEYTTTNYFDFSVGAMFYKSNTYWLGFSMHHINSPEQGFFMDESRLPIKYTFQAGYKFEHHIKSMSSTDVIQIYPCILYKSQVTYDQADYGVYTYYNHYMVGIFYRGIYFKEFEDERNNDAITAHIGYGYNNWEFFYSYDFTTSRIKQQNTHGSHEISIVHKFCMDFPKQKKMHHTNRTLPCPDFRTSKFKKGKKEKQSKKIKKKGKVMNKHKS